MRRILRIRQTAGLAAPARYTPGTACTRQICTRPAASSTSTLRPTATPSANLFRSAQPASLRYSSSSTPSNKPEPTAVDSQSESQDSLEALDADEATWQDTDSSLVLPPEPSRAPERSHINDATYAEAESGEGLEEVGGLEGYWEGGGHWNPAHEIQTFAAGKTMDPAVLEVVARQAVVEALAVRQQGEKGPGLMAQWGVGGLEQRNAVLGVQATVGGDGKVELAGDVQGVVEGLSGGRLVGTPAEQLEAGEARELVKSWRDPSWKDISLEDDALKFAVTKRIYQLTGHLIRDARLRLIDTVHDLLDYLLVPPKPEKVHEQIQTQGLLEALPNVKVWDRRVTPIDKDKMTGRWKVIVEELEKRDLPVTGTGGYGKMVEKKWFTPQVMSRRKARKLKLKGEELKRHGFTSV